jgi:hypothetical protein
MSSPSSAKVVGAWRFVGARLTTESGEVGDTPPDYMGYLIYTADGHVAYLRMKAQLPAFAAGNLEHGTAEEKLAAYDNFVAYCAAMSSVPATRSCIMSRFPAFRMSSARTSYERSRSTATNSP